MSKKGAREVPDNHDILKISENEELNHWLSKLVLEDGKKKRSR